MAWPRTPRAHHAGWSNNQMVPLPLALAIRRCPIGCGQKQAIRHERKWIPASHPYGRDCLGEMPVTGRIRDRHRPEPWASTYRAARRRRMGHVILIRPTAGASHVILPRRIGKVGCGSSWPMARSLVACRPPRSSGMGSRASAFKYDRSNFRSEGFLTVSPILKMVGDDQTTSRRYRALTLQATAPSQASDDHGVTAAP